MAARLRNATGTRPVITAVGDALWQVVLENERVRLTIDYRGHLGKVKWAGSTLTVDGKQRPIAAGFDDFTRIWREHSPGGKRSRSLELAPVPQGTDLTAMPAEVRTIYSSLRAKADTAGLDQVAVEAGFGNGRWVVGVTVPSGGIRFAFTRRGGARHWAFSTRSLQVVRDGQDLSSDAQGDISKALSLLAAPPPREPQKAGGTIPGPAPAASSNAVRERRHSVIRN
jgi:hypothetical protein